MMVVTGLLRPFTRTHTRRVLPYLAHHLKNLTNNKHSLCGCPNRIPSKHNTTPPVVYMHWRGFFTLPGGGGDLTKEHSESKLIGYTMEQMYEIVADVDQYQQFVPFCTGSQVIQRSENHARANLEVGFQFVKERYTSVLTLARPNLVKSECMDGTLFNHLTCVWKFSKGPPNIPNSCTLNFYISFEFKSVLHSQLSAMFFEQVVMKMVEAFLQRARQLHGPSSLESGVGVGRRRPGELGPTVGGGAGTTTDLKARRPVKIRPRKRIISIPKD